MTENIYKCMEKDSFKECFDREMKEYFTRMNTFLPNLDYNQSLKRALQIPIIKKNDEILTFFRNALLKNYRLKSSLKTTRF